MKMETKFEEKKDVAHAQLFSPPLSISYVKKLPTLLSSKCVCVQVLPPDSRKAPASIACGTRKQKK
jgi:hypothetical protein